MDETKEILSILEKYDKKIIETYQKITKIVKEERHRIKRSEIRARIRQLVEEVTNYAD